MLNSGFTAAAATRRAARAAIAVEREIVLFVNQAATEFQIVELKVWSSPK
jgi:hypothetical protein